MSDKSMSVQADKRTDITQAILLHLYEYPLYQCVEKEDRAIRVMIIGFDRYGQEFLDACLQAGQMKDYFINVTVFPDSDEEKEYYLNARPELGSFFNVDGSLDELILGDRLRTDDLYGAITFEKNWRSDKAENYWVTFTEQKSSVLSPSYIFISLGESKRNKSLARICEEAAKVQNWNCLISYVCEEAPKEKEQTQCGGRIPFYVNADIKKDPLYAEIERMAFNSHLVWETGLNIDYSAVRREFRKKYNHDSSVGNVLSLKYKLHSIGIDLEECGYEDAARKFNAAISVEENQNIRNDLICVEHRRWVAEKLCQGWTTRSVDQCVNGITKDEQHRQHVCLVRSRPDQNLAENFSIKDWDKAKKEKLAELDALDQMSVRLHQFYMRKAKAANRQDILSDSATNGIQSLLMEYGNAYNAFREWLACMKDIRHGDRERVFLYDGLQNTLKQSINDLPADKKRLADIQIDLLDQKFRPILESMRYKDWKQNDADLIDNIPFILTFRDDIHMIIPYATGNNTAVFGNVAAPTVVNPAKIIYIYLVREKRDLTELCRSVPGVVAYMKKKAIRSKVEFVLLFEGIDPSSEDNLSLQEKILDAGAGRIKKPIRCISGSAGMDCWEALESYFKNKVKRTKNAYFVAERNITKLSAILGAGEFYSLFPDYIYNSIDRKFETVVRCDLLRYIPQKEYITCSEMMTLAGVDIKEDRHPEFYEKYKELWMKYRNNRNLWKEFCGLIKPYTKKKIIASFEKKGAKAPKEEKYTYILPFECANAANTIVKYLKEKSIAESYSSVKGYTSDSCLVTICDKRNNKSNYDKAFEKNVNSLMNPSIIKISEKEGKVNIYKDSLFVSNMTIPQSEAAEDEENNPAVELAEFFAGIGYFADFKVNENNTVSFRFASGQVKELFRKEGNLLEIYIYHKLKAAGEYDDIISSNEITRNKDTTKLVNEFDCIFTKGFCSWFIECKARSSINEEFYYRISALAQTFGINPRIVLIAEAENEEEFQKNDQMIKRGEELGITTILKADDVENIDQSICRIMNDDIE